MKGKEIQEQMVSNMKNWQKIEDASVESTGKIMEQTENPVIKLVMEIIQRDSKFHSRVQEFIAASLENQPVSLTPEEMGKVWDGIEKHIQIEKKMVGCVDEALAALKGRKMVVQEYLLNYLRQDEKKHDDLLDSLQKIKSGMYPYG